MLLFKKSIGLILRKVFSLLPDRIYVYLDFWHFHKYFPDLKHQRRFSERITFRRLYPCDTRFSDLSDKNLARKYVVEKVGEKVLVPLFAVADDMADFDFSCLPASYVMKATHGSGWVEIIRKNQCVNVEDLRQKAQKWLSLNYYTLTRERHYRDLKPQIMFEQLLLDKNGKVPKDFKIHCFRKGDQLVQIVQVDSNRFEYHTRDFYSSSWELLDLTLRYPASLDRSGPAPESLAEMLKIADELSKPFNYVRVDLYSVEGKIYFGEMTFTHGCGKQAFEPQEEEQKWAGLFEDDRTFYQSRRRGRNI